MVEMGFSLEELLETGHATKIKVDTKHEDLVIPKHLVSVDYIVLTISYNTNGLVVDYDGICCSLYFDAEECECFIPWDAVLGYAGDSVRHLQSGNKAEQTEQAEQVVAKPKRPSWLRVIEGGKK